MSLTYKSARTAILRCRDNITALDLPKIANPNELPIIVGPIGKNQDDNSVTKRIQDLQREYGQYPWLDILFLLHHNGYLEDTSISRLVMRDSAPSIKDIVQKLMNNQKNYLRR